MASPEPTAGTIYDDEIQIEKNAGLVMATNNSSIVSKRSVEKLYLPEPHFFRYFVKKPIRRAPTINRGYWLRMRAVDWVVQQFLEKPSEHRKVIINLGCGYDPLPFQWLARDAVLCANTKFVDVDYDLLMEAKALIVRDTPRMHDLLNKDEVTAESADKSILFDSKEYAAIGCDLRNTRRLERLLRNVVDIEKCLILCVAEVSITYMHTDAADALISWTSTLSPDVTFCLLEQCSPDQEDHPFTMTMMKHFAKLGTPIQSVLEYPGSHAQNQRFRSAGYTHCDYQNLWELWADPRFLTPSQRMSLDHVEPFDEWEEFALFASHYCLVVAHNREIPILAERPRSRRDSTTSLSSDISARTSSPHKPHNEWFTFEYSKEPGDLCQRHHASAYTIPGQEAIGVHGGIGTRCRLSSTAVARPRHLEAETPVVPSPEMGARCCHTVTPLDDGKNLLVGGRASPKQVYKDCWLQTGNVWQRIDDLPEPRYRHRVSRIVLPDNTSGAVCYGGKVDACTVAVDVLLWEPTRGWRRLRTSGEDPVPRFAPLFMRLGHNHGLLAGGMRQDGIICQGLWRWKLVNRKSQIYSIAFRQTKALDASAGAWPWFARFGASYSMQRDEILMLGGIGMSGCIPAPYEILSIIGGFTNYKDYEHELPLRLGCVTPKRDANCPRPFLIGHSTHVTRSGLSITIGGGATCFSFGNYFNTGIWILNDSEMDVTGDWVVVPVKPAVLSPSNDQMASRESNGEVPQPKTQHVHHVKASSREEFASIARWLEPRIIDDLDFGTCTQKWSIPYLREKIPPERAVVVHDSPARTMNFLRKDFSYRTLSFEDFLSRLNEPDSHLYLRTLSADAPTSSPAHLDGDWPEIASDFHIPPEMADVKSSLHSSPLRISNNVNMWLHYDVMANVLFQVAGMRKLVIFPPTDLLKLKFPPGSTTSELDLLGPSERGKEFEFQIPPGTEPWIAVLKPGDILYIPPLWAHSGVSLPSDQGHKSQKHDAAPMPVSPSSQNNIQVSTSPSSITTSKAESCNGTTTQRRNPYVSISVNVFFRNLPSAAYAAGRDVYGNRDLACYEDGRKAVERVISKFSDGKQIPGASDGSSLLMDWIPKDIRKAYLLRLAKELETRAETL